LKEIMATKKSTKAFDIHKPGKTAPDASARPTIVTNRTLKRDPMMREDPAVSASEPAPEQAEFKPHTELKIQPLHSDITPEDSPVTTEPAAAEPATEPAKPTDNPEPAEEAAPAADTAPAAPAEPATPTEQPATDTPPAEPEPTTAETAGAPADEAAPPDAKAAAKTAAADQVAAEQAKLVQKLADSHKYYLPINQVKKRHNRAALTWLLVIIVIIIAADLALDAGLFSIPNFQPPTHFFGH
jgi:hypothetical protein